MISGTTIGFALCGSFCTFEKVIPQIASLKNMGANIIPIVSEAVFCTDTRFGAHDEICGRIEEICENKIIHTIKDAEPIGPKKLLDVLVIAPATGNTIAKLACGIADTPVTLAAKAHLRNERPIVLAVSTNDALAGNAANIGKLLNTKHLFFVPMRQDDAFKKPRSIVAEMTMIPQTIEYALSELQIQPILI